MSVQPLKAILGGVAGTAVMTGMMYFVAPMMTGRRMDIAAALGALLGGSWALGMLAHLANGVVVFPLAYAFGARPFLPGASVVKGVAFGVLLWLLAQGVLMPLLGAGFFSMATGGIKSAMASLVGHSVYGALLGVIAGEDPAAHVGAHRRR